MASPAVAVYRIGNWFHRNKMKPIGKFISWMNRLWFATWIPSSAKIGKKFTVGYWGLGVVIHSNTVIGNNCTIGQNVTIGRNLKDVNVPQLGDNVYVGTGTVIFGEIKIGNNVTIGANSVINKDVEDNCVVVGNPFRIIKKNNE